MAVVPYKNSPANFYVETSAGALLPNYSNNTVSGASPSGGFDLPQDVWPGGSVYSGQPQSNLSDTISIVSTSADDNLANISGFIIVGLENSESEIQTREFILADAASGLNNIVGLIDFYRITTMFVLGGTNVGTITAFHTSTPVNIFAIIEPLLNFAKDAVYTVPANHTATICSFSASLFKFSGSLVGDGLLEVKVRPPGSDYLSVVTIPLNNASPSPINYCDIGAMVAGTDLKYTMLEASADTMVCALTAGITNRRIS